jgi:hypothetical protein
MPPPTPVPRITPKTVSKPWPAPSIASDSVKQLASLATRTGRESLASRSARSGRPMSHVELAFLTSPVVRLTTPGMPTPTEPARPVSASISATRRTIVSRVPA